MKVLVPLDGSPMAEEALRAADRLLRHEDGGVLHLHRRLVDDQSRTDVGNMFQRRQTVGLERIAGIDHIDDVIGQPDQRRQFPMELRLKMVLVSLVPSF